MRRLLLPGWRHYTIPASSEEIRAVGQRRRLEQSSGGIPSTSVVEAEARALQQTRVAFAGSFKVQTPQAGQAQAFVPQEPLFVFAGACQEHAQDPILAEQACVIEAAGRAAAEVHAQRGWQELDR